MFNATHITRVMLTVCVASCCGCREKQASHDEAAEQMSSFSLMTASADALKSGRVEDAAFLFLAGRTRYQIDRQIYTPVKTGGDSPDVLASALFATIGEAVKRAIAANPTASAKASARLAKWSPKFPDGYHPGWEYRNPLQGQAVTAVVAQVKTEVRAAVDSKSKLLANAEYAQLNEQLAAARAVENRYWAEVNKDGKIQPVSDELRKQYAQAVEQKNAAAKRMREIEWQISPESRWHLKLGWKAEDFFTDDQVIALCRAIEADDIPEMKRLIATGVNVNAVGKDGMTPLLWAFPEAKIERFQCLLENGADPNVAIQSDFGTRGLPFHPYPAGGHMFDDRGCHAGQSVTHLACRSPQLAYCKLVMMHGGDPNLVDQQTGQVPLDIVIGSHIPDIERRVELLLAKGANPNRYCKYELAYPLMQAIQINRFNVALTLLNAGADPSLYQPEGLRKAVHFLANKDRDLQHYDSKRTSEYKALVDSLERSGESLEQARKDKAEWEERLKGAPFGPSGHAVKVNRIISERKAKEPTNPSNKAIDAPNRASR
jgi:ankyrin repeat protein